MLIDMLIIPMKYIKCIAREPYKIKNRIEKNNIEGCENYRKMKLVRHESRHAHARADKRDAY